MCRPFTDIETHWERFYLEGHTTWGDHVESIWCAWFWLAYEYMPYYPEDVFPDRSDPPRWDPVRLHCERDPPKKHTCFYCGAVQNFFAVHMNFFEFIWIFWLMEGDIWTETIRSCHMLNRWRCSCSYIMEIFTYFS